MTRSIPLAATVSLALFFHISFNAPMSLYIGNALVLGDANIQQLLAELLPIALIVSLVAFLLLVEWPKTFLVRRLSGWLIIFAIAGFQFALFLDSESTNWSISVLASFVIGLAVAVLVPERLWRTALLAVSIFVFFNTGLAATKAWPDLLKKSDLALSLSAESDNPFDRPFRPDAPAERFFGTFPPGAPGLNSYSAEKNVVILLIDTFQNDIAERMLEPAHFEGFTFYRNASSVFPYTGMSLPVIHSGEVYELGEDLVDYFKRADDARVERDLLAQGFAIDHLGLWERAVHTYGNNVAVLMANKTLLSVFRERQIPQAIRDYWPQIANHRKEDTKGLTPTDHTDMDLDTFSAVIERLRVDAREPRFKWLHFWGTHMPSTLNAECGAVKIVYTTENYEAQARCMVRQVRAYLQALKSAGIYDQTQIFIMADHGTREIPINGDATDSPVPWKVRAAAHPMLLFKDFNAKGPMTFSDKAVSHRDIKPTILGRGGLKSPSGEERIFMDYGLAIEIQEEKLYPTVYQIGADVRHPDDWSLFD